VSIVRVGLAETKGYAEGHDAIFGKRTTAKKAPAPKKAPVKKAKRAAKASAAKGKKKGKKK
jgi:hypothetical protein